jgi:hypothetical protein
MTGARWYKITTGDGYAIRDSEHRAVAICRGWQGNDANVDGIVYIKNNAIALADEIDRLRAELAARDRAREHTVQWYAVRIERIKDVAKESGMLGKVAAILANGTADIREPPTYDQQLNMMRHRAEKAESQLAAANAMADRLVAAISRYSIYAQAKGSAPFGATQDEKAALADYYAS